MLRTLHTPIILFTLISTTCAQSIVQNALDFDGSDDEVIVPNASALISGSNEMSLTCWVLPTNMAPQFPDLDGIVGIRNSTNADFYLIQIDPATTLEARMRNSAGVNTDVVFNGLQVGQWQHLALVYNGAELTLYHNAINVGSMSATGTITATAEPLRIGNLDWFGTDFLLDGAVDEVTLWSKALSQTEVTCMMMRGVDPFAAQLELYYKFDQGTPGGSNTGIAALVPAAGNLTGSFNGLALNGTNSNFVAGAPSSPSLYASICNGDVYPFAGQNLTQPGIYSNVVPMGSCDSIEVLTLEVEQIDTNVTASAGSIMANLVGGAYQWLDCTNGLTPVSGATAQSYSPPTIGSFAVQVTSQSGCVDTSGCHVVTPVSINELTNGTLKLFPTHTSGQLSLEWPAWWRVAGVEVVDISGRVMMQLSSSIQGKINVEALPSGTYFLLIDHRTGRSMARFVKR